MALLKLSKLSVLVGATIGAAALVGFGLPATAGPIEDPTPVCAIDEPIIFDVFAPDCYELVVDQDGKVDKKQSSDDVENVKLERVDDKKLKLTFTGFDPREYVVTAVDLTSDKTRPVTVSTTEAAIEIEIPRDRPFRVLFEPKPKKNDNNLPAEPLPGEPIDDTELCVVEEAEPANRAEPAEEAEPAGRLLLGPDCYRLTITKDQKVDKDLSSDDVEGIKSITRGGENDSYVVEFETFDPSKHRVLGINLSTGERLDLRRVDGKKVVVFIGANTPFKLFFSPMPK